MTATWPISCTLPGVDAAGLARRIRERASTFRVVREDDHFAPVEAALSRLIQAARPGSDLEALVATQPGPPLVATRPHYHYHELAAFHDDAFVDACYRALLGRPPDLHGAWRQLDGLRRGQIEKIEVIVSIIMSEEGGRCQAAGRVIGWRWRWNLHRLMRKPWIGPPLRWLRALAALGQERQRLVALEARHQALVSDQGHLIGVLRRELLQRAPARIQAVEEVHRAWLAVQRAQAGTRAAPQVPSSRRSRVAFVVPRCGPEVVGGAEALGLALAKSMQGLWEVEILTSCAIDYTTWADHYPAGEAEVGGVPVRRFRVDAPRDQRTFNRIYGDAVRTPQMMEGEELDRFMIAQGPHSSALLEHLKTHGRTYDAVFFLPYLYATTWFGLPLVADRSVLIPCAHDEPPLRFAGWPRFLGLPAAWLFMTEDEEDLIRNRFPGIHAQGPIAAQQVEEPDDVSADRFRAAYRVARPFLLYLGRIEESKGCHELFAHWQAMKAAWSDAPDLILAGKQNMRIPEAPGIRYLGFLPDRDRWDATAACHALVNPSPFESLSLVLLEAWALARPTIVNGHCAVLDGQTRRSGCGRQYRSSAEFAAAVRAVMADQGMAANGPDFVRNRYSRAHIRTAMQACLQRVREASARSQP